MSGTRVLLKYQFLRYCLQGETDSFAAHSRVFTSKPIKFLSVKFLTNRRLALIYCAPRSVINGFRWIRDLCQGGQPRTESRRRHGAAKGKQTVYLPVKPTVKTHTHTPKDEDQLRLCPGIQTPNNLRPNLAHSFHHRRQFLLWLPGPPCIETVTAWKEILLLHLYDRENRE